jgi:hypothetical protein
LFFSPHGDTHKTTATGTRSVVRKTSTALVPYEVITNSPTRHRKKNKSTLDPTKADQTDLNNAPTSSEESNEIQIDQHLHKAASLREAEMDSMEIRQLHSSQKEAMKKMSEFSGESTNIGIDEWLFDLTNLFSLMKLKDETRILETMGKLTGPALKWYQENLRSFNSWDDTEKALKNRFREFTSSSQLIQEFFQMQQEENQTVTSFYDNVIRKYKKAKELITEQQVVIVLQTGVKQSLKEQLIRKEKDMDKPEKWLHLAQEEEYVQKQVQQRNGSYYGTTTKPFFEPMMATTVQRFPSSAQPSNQYVPMSYNSNRQQQWRSYQPVEPRTYAGQQQYPRGQQSSRSEHDNQRTIHRRSATGTEKKQLHPKPCLICNRNNHSTSECFHKKNTGCFKCGQSNHRVRDCPEHFFE